jgi:iron complex outermembrane receptor protein
MINHILLATFTVVVSLILIPSTYKIVYAQDSADSQEGSEQTTLDTIVVGATRIASKIMETPAVVTVINGDDVRKHNYETINDVLKQESGFFYDEARGNLQLRGQNTSDVQVLVDGVPSFSTFNNDGLLDSVPLFNVDKIEVLKGASSTLFGANAVAGVINVTTKEPDSNQAKFKFGYGNENTIYGGFDIYIRGDKIGFGFGYEYKKSDGYRQRYAIGTISNTPSHTIGSGGFPIKGVTADQYVVGDRGKKGYERDNIWFNIKYDFTDSISFKYNLSYYLFEAVTKDTQSYVVDVNGNPLFIGSVPLQNGKYANFTESNFTDYLNRTEVLRNGLQFVDTDRNINLNIGFSLIINDGYITGTTLRPGSGSVVDYPGKTYNIDFQKEWDNLGRHRLLAGFTLRRDEMKYTSLQLSDWHNDSTTIGVNYHSEGKDQMAAVFFQDEISITDKFTLYAGVRFDLYKNFDGASDFYQSDPNIHLKYPAHSYSQFSPKISLQYSATDQLSMYVSFGHAFRPPDLYQLFRLTNYNPSGGNYYYVGNPWLRPEKSNTFEVGIKSTYFNSDFEISYFHTKTDDAIAAVEYPPGTFPIVIDPTQNVRAYTNVNQEIRQGIDVSLKTEINDYFNSFINYTWQRGDNKGGLTAGQVIDDIPRHLFNVGVDFEYRAFELSLVGRYVSKLGDTSSPTGIYNVSNDPHFTVDLTSNLTLFDNYQLTLSVSNLFDKFYYQEYIVPGRRIMLSLTATFD